MDAVTHSGGVSRRASLIGAFGIATLVGAAATPPPSPAKAASRHRNGDLYLLGDSWGAGLHADPAHALGQVAAEVLDMRPVVDAVSGTGYVNTAGHQNYLQRARSATGSARLVVVQGGSNDKNQPTDELAENARDTLRTLRGRFPNAKLLVLGPGPDPAPVDAKQRTVDTTLQQVAHSLDIRYASMLQRDWIPDAELDTVIDPSTAHPTVEGQFYLGTRLAAAVRLVHPQLFA